MQVAAVAGRVLTSGLGSLLVQSRFLQCVSCNQKMLMMGAAQQLQGSSFAWHRCLH